MVLLMKKIFYLYKSGTLKRKDNSLCLQSKNTVDYIPIEQTDMIICFGEISFNKRVLSLLNAYHIPILFYNFHGKYIGSFVPKEHKNGKILFTQANAYQNEETRSYIAHAFWQGSFHNMISVMKYYKKKGHPLEKQIEIVSQCEETIKKEASINKGLLIEARAKKAYYECFDIILDHEPFVFEKRVVHPPNNEINAMLSYGYALLYGIFIGTLETSSLCTEISFIHSIEKGTDTLQFDLADIIKPVIVDRLVLRLIRKHQVTPLHFLYLPSGACYLNKDGVELFVREFDKVLESRISYQGRSYSYRSLINKEVYRLEEFLHGKTKKLKPFKIGW